MTETGEGTSASSHGTDLTALQAAIHHAAELLPFQGPITAFVFDNTLQGFRDFTFDDGVQAAAKLFGCEPYLPEERYREKLASGRIRESELFAVLGEDLGSDGQHMVAGLASRLEIRQAMLQHRLHTGSAEELRWFVAETSALRQLRREAPGPVRDRFIQETRRWVMRDLRGQPAPDQSESTIRRSERLLADLIPRFGASTIERWPDSTWEAFSLQAMWRICREGITAADALTPPRIQRRPAYALRDWLKEATGEDIDSAVNDILTRYCAAFTDQGLAAWGLPHRDQGFYRAFLALYGQDHWGPEPWTTELQVALADLNARGISPLEAIAESLAELGVTAQDWPEFLPACLIPLRGWASLLWQMETRPDRVPKPAAPGTLTEFLAIRLVLCRVAALRLARERLDYSGPLHLFSSSIYANRPAPALANREPRAFLVFQLAQLLGWTPPQLAALHAPQWQELALELDQFHHIERRRLFHQALELRFRTRALDALAIQTQQPTPRIAQPRFQAVFCIDTREESFRRRLEELEPTAETFGAAGFFGIPIYFKGVAEAHYSTLCPIVVRPRHWVTEEVLYSLRDAHQQRRKTREALGRATHQVHMGSRNFASGAILTMGLGVIASIPLVARVLFPRLSALLVKTASRLVEAPTVTRLRLERATPDPGPEGDAIGFSVQEMAEMSERLLRDIGLTSGFAKLVFFLGHGSFCLNNPHKSSYDCGACSGSAGGPNARALASMLNDPRVREQLEVRGLIIPRETVFLGGLHNTCNDTLRYYDLDQLLPSHQQLFESAQETFRRTCELNAHERCRRFHSAPLDISPAEALQHVEGRAEDLAQVRPEFGNATNAMCFVGRRDRVRGLFLDRRSFLVSYDPAQDNATHDILARILGAVVPVCEGINLQYFFSYIDSPGWGSGSKLPHNVTSLLGVMDGAASDLRAGLPWQGVEIHEPVRLLFVIETTPAAIRLSMDRNPIIGRIIRNGWVQLAVLDPQSSQIQWYRSGEFVPHRPSQTELPRAASSTEWYRGWRDHLDFAVIESATHTAAQGAR